MSLLTLKERVLFGSASRASACQAIIMYPLRDLTFHRDYSIASFLLSEVDKPAPRARISGVVCYEAELKPTNFLCTVLDTSFRGCELQSAIRKGRSMEKVVTLRAEFQIY